jgi:hypothetical protein
MSGANLCHGGKLGKTKKAVSNKASPFLDPGSSSFELASASPLGYSPQ